MEECASAVALTRWEAVPHSIERVEPSKAPTSGKLIRSRPAKKKTEEMKEATMREAAIPLQEGMTSQAAAAQKLERVAKAIFWEMNAVMHDHDELWRKCDNQNVYRDCARAAIVAAAHG